MRQSGATFCRLQGARKTDKERLKILSAGIAFEAPIAVVALARMSIVTIAQRKPWRGCFIVRACVVSAVVTRPT